MQYPELVIRTDPTPLEIGLLEDRLYEFNAKTTGIDDALGLAIFERDDQDEVVAGLCGHTWGGCCEIRQLWVHEKVRGRGIGRRVMELTEEVARSVGARDIELHAFAQNARARRLYESLGYRITSVGMRKTLG